MKGLGLVKGLIFLVGKHKSAILSGTAIASAIGTVVLTVRATIKSAKDIEEAREEKYVQTNDNADEEFVEKEGIKLTVKETVKATWKHYIPVVVGIGATVTCIVCAHHIDAKRIAAATSALFLSEKMNKELENKTIEEFGKEKLDQIKEKIFHENKDLESEYRVNGQSLRRDVMKHGASNVGFCKPEIKDRMCWFKEDFTGRYVWASRNQIEKAINLAVRDAYRNGCRVITLNDLYDYMDLDQIPDGHSFGWDLQAGQELDVTYEPDITDTGEPCLVMHYHCRPRMI